MSGDREPLFWMTNKEWYTADREHDEFVLTDKAPERAIKSFELYKRINGKDIDESVSAIQAAV